MPSEAAGQVTAETPLRVDGTTLGIQLITLICVLLIIPLFEVYTLERPAQIVGLSVLFVTGFLVNRRYPGIRLGNWLVVLTLPMTWATLFVDHVGLFATSCFLGGIFFVITAVVVMWEVFHWHTATVESIYGAVSAYLLLGLAWAMFYWGLDVIDRAALEIPNRRQLAVSVGGEPLTAFSQMIYFSFVCLSSVGFGDISPATASSETLAWLQSVVGVFYLAILVSRLVGAIPVGREGVERSVSEDQNSKSKNTEVK